MSFQRMTVSEFHKLSQDEKEGLLASGLQKQAIHKVDMAKKVKGLIEKVPPFMLTDGEMHATNLYYNGSLRGTFVEQAVATATVYIKQQIGVSVSISPSSQVTIIGDVITAKESTPNPFILGGDDPSGIQNNPLF